MENKVIDSFMRETDNLVYLAECGKFDHNKIFDALGRMRTAYMAVIDGLQITEIKRHDAMINIRNYYLSTRDKISCIICK